MSGKGKAASQREREKAKSKNHKGGQRTFTDSRTAGASAFVIKKVFSFYFRLFFCSF